MTEDAAVSFSRSALSRRRWPLAERSPERRAGRIVDDDVAVGMMVDMQSAPRPGSPARRIRRVATIVALERDPAGLVGWVRIRDERNGEQRSCLRSGPRQWLVICPGEAAIVVTPRV